MDGRGRTAEIPNLAAQPEEYLVEAMNAYREGRRHHAALQELFGSFSGASIRNIAAFYSALPPLPPEAIEVADGHVYREGAEVARRCTGCHGEQGISDSRGVPSLAGQQPAYLIVSTQEYASGERGHAGKEEMLRGLQQVDVEKMAMYFASQVPQPRDPPGFGDPARGEPLSAVCGSCHGARGISRDPLIPNLAGQEPVYLVEALKAYRAHERSHKDMVTDKSDEEFEDIAAFYAVQEPASATRSEDDLIEVVAKCDRCHDRAGGDSAIILPRLNGQHPEYLLRVMKEYRDEDRGNSMMHKMSAGYSDELLQEIASYYAKRAPRQ